MAKEHRVFPKNESLSQKENTIAQRLTEVNRNELAGARFFADYHRHDSHKVPDVFRQASALPTRLIEAAYFTQASNLIQAEFSQEPTLVYLPTDMAYLGGQ